MATVEKRTHKSGKASYRITVSAGTDSSGKQIRLRKTWEPPKPGMSERQIEKALSRAAADFEREVEQGYRLDHKQSFTEYANYVIALKERAGIKARTIESYQGLLERVDKAIGHLKLADIRPQHLNAFYQNLCEEGIRQDKGKATPRFDIRLWLKSNHVSIARLATAAGVSSSTVSTAADGHTVSKKSAERIAQAMEQPLSKVFNVELDTSPLSNKTVLEYHRFISTVLSQAENEMLIPFNPATKATPPKVKRKEPDYYQPDQLYKILDALSKAALKWRTVVYLLIDTGCRRGEIAGLKWDSIDFNNGIVKIDNALLYSRKKGVYEDTTKTDNTRFLRLAPETLAVLAEWQAEQQRMQQAHGDAWVNSGFVFTQTNGARINPDSITNWLDKFSKTNNLPHIHPHAFRHTAASMMIANGVDIVTAANELGHANASTTTTIYAHQIAEAKAKASNVRAGIFKKKDA